MCPRVRKWGSCHSAQIWFHLILSSHIKMVVVVVIFEDDVDMIGCIFGDLGHVPRDAVDIVEGNSHCKFNDTTKSVLHILYVILVLQSGIE